MTSLRFPYFAKIIKSFHCWQKKDNTLAKTQSRKGYMTSLCACLPQAGLPYFARKKERTRALPACCRQSAEAQKIYKLNIFSRIKKGISVTH
jgi:hypothetical protein